jgi:sulfur carrier protein
MMNESRVSSTQGVEVRINGKDREIPDGLTVRGLLEHLELEPSLVVVERNREILSRDEYSRVRVGPGDLLELVHFVGGG